MIPISEQCPVVVVDTTAPLITGASTVTGTAYMRIGEIGEPGGVALVLVEAEAVENLLQALTGLAEQMRTLPRPLPKSRPVLRAVTG